MPLERHASKATLNTPRVFCYSIISSRDKGKGGFWGCRLNFGGKGRVQVSANGSVIARN